MTIQEILEIAFARKSELIKLLSESDKRKKGNSKTDILARIDEIDVLYARIKNEECPQIFNNIMERSLVDMTASEPWNKTKIRKKRDTVVATSEDKDILREAVGYPGHPFEQ